MSRLRKAIKNPNLILLYLLKNKISRLIPDKQFIKIEYYLKTKERLNLSSLETYNEKLQYLKLFDRNIFYTDLVDKYKVREHISEVIGDEHLIPLLGVYNSFDEIDFKNLPDKFVIKPNHTSGDIYICKDKGKVDFEDLRKKITYWLKREYFWLHREWPYKLIKPKIICEKYMIDESENDLKDYKFFCFQGEPKLIQVDMDRFGKHKQNFYDINWNFRDVKIWCDNDQDNVIPKPKNFDKMLKICRELSQGIPHVRVDLYNINGHIYFGELTFFHQTGMANFIDKDLEVEMGNWLDLSTINDRERI